MHVLLVYLVSGDGYLMHGVVDRLQQLEHGVQGLLQFTAVSLLRTVLQQLLTQDRDTGGQVSGLQGN